VTLGPFLLHSLIKKKASVSVKHRDCLAPFSQKACLPRRSSTGCIYSNYFVFLVMRSSENDAYLPDRNTGRKRTKQWLAGMELPRCRADFVLHEKKNVIGYSSDNSYLQLGMKRHVHVGSGGERWPLFAWHSFCCYLRLR
jgi:hypothetical protein